MRCFLAQIALVLAEFGRFDEAIALATESRQSNVRRGAFFTPFVQRGADRTGFGLGLAIALQAIAAHGGSIRVEDHSGEGCEFILVWPVSPTLTEIARP